MYPVNIKEEEDSKEFEDSPQRVGGEGHEQKKSGQERKKIDEDDENDLDDDEVRKKKKKSWSKTTSTLILAYQSFGVVYGDLSTSPLYVYTSIFEQKLEGHRNPEAIFGAFSLIFWTLTLIPLLKYVFIVLNADDNGEGGTFALYSLLCRHAKFSLLPNQQASDEELSTYKYTSTKQTSAALPLKRFLEKHKKSRTVLLLVVLLGVCMVIGDGVITPAISVLSSLSGLEATQPSMTPRHIRAIACIILISLFALQHFGTHKVAFLFAPVVVLWLFSIFAIGIYNIIHWNPEIVYALSPHYIVKFFKATGRDGWISLGGVLLAITGTEAMFVDIGHFTALPVRIAFSCVVYPCLVIQYMGQAAFLSKNLYAIPFSFYESIPGMVFWPVFGIATLAAIVASQAIITATFSIVKQCHALGCFPRVKVVHTSKDISGQIYIPEVNWILMILTLAIALGYRDTSFIGNAYGLACMTVMFITTFLMALVIVFVWQRHILFAAAFLLFWLVEGFYLSAAIMKVGEGGWISLLLAFAFMAIMVIWYYGTRKKFKFDMHNKVPLKWLLGLGPSLGIVRVPGIGLVYSELATGVPAIFSHFVTNLPAFHQVLVFVCVKSVPVPCVPPEERFLIGRVCPRSYRMYRCIVRYGYKDVPRDDGNFENLLIQSIAEFIQMEAGDPQFSSPDATSFDARMAVISTKSAQSTLTLVVSEEGEEEEDCDVNNSIESNKSSAIQSLRSSYDDENLGLRKRQVRFQLPESPGMDLAVREELMDLIQAKEAGVAYIVGHSYVQARRSSSFFKKFIIDIVYSFLRKNCRGPAVALNIPHISLIEVGMIYHV